MEVIIIGGGIAGLNTAYKLIKKNPNMQITILEKYNYIGGRINTFVSKYMKVEAGAGRFNNKNKLLLGLLRDFGLLGKIITIGSDSKVVDIKRPGLLQESEVLTILKKLINDVKYSENDLINMEFSEYMKKKVTKEEMKYLYDFFGYTSEITEMNAYITIEILKTYFMKDVDFYALKGGLSQLTNSMVDYLRRNNVKVLKNREVINIEKCEKKYEIEVEGITKKYICDVCVCAVPKNVIERFGIFKDINPLLKAIKLKPLCRIYMRFSDVKWMKDIPRLTINNQLRYIIPIDKERGIIMISYTDNYYAEYWKKLNEERGLRGVIKRHKELIKEGLNIEMPHPLETKMFYWEDGVAFYGKGFDSKKMTKRIMVPIKGEKLYICGENYSEKDTAWIEGALESSEYIVKQLNK